MMDPSPRFGTSGPAALDGLQRRLVRRHLRRCRAWAGRSACLPEAAVSAAARLATGPAGALPAPVAELVSMTLDELAP